MSLTFNEEEVAKKFDEALPTELPRPLFVKRGDRFKATGGIYISVRNATRSVDTIITAKELPLTPDLVKAKAADLLEKWNAVAPKEAKPVTAKMTEHPTIAAQRKQPSN